MDRLAFGTFELDIRTGELWKGGHRIKLAGQPFKMLTILASRPGEVVARSEMQGEIWGADTNVDFERAIAGGINKVREALGDSADNPRFIQTLPKRGYRFIAPVHHISAPTTPLRGAPAPEDDSLRKDLPAPTGAEPESLPSGVPAISDFPDGSAPVLYAGDAHSALGSPPVLTGTTPAFLAQMRSAGRNGAWVAVAGLGVALLLSLLASWALYRRAEEVGPLRVNQVTHIGSISAGPPNLENLLTLATDGNRILTSVLEGGRTHLAAVAIGTGEVQPIPLPNELTASLLVDISRDGSRLLLKGHESSASEQPLWIVPSSGGSGLRVGEVLAHDAAWMPDGSGVLMARGNAITELQLDNGSSTTLATLPGRAFWMRWSPDGRVLRFTLQNPSTHTSGIWELTLGAGAARQVKTPGGKAVSSCCGTWTPDGRDYVFVTNDNLWDLKGEGRLSELVQLTNGPLRFFSPVVDRGGSRVFFLGLDQPVGMQVLDDQGAHPLPTFLADATRLEYSRDGMWVAWVDNDFRLWRARAADGSDKVQLTPGGLDVFMVRWSPDGKKLAVMARQPGTLWKIYLVGTEGGDLRPVLAEDRNVADPGWSPDGRDLVFGRQPDLMGKENGPHTIEVLHLATMRTETLPGSEGKFSPRWSPDGRWIAALALDQRSVWLYDVHQGRWQELARTSAADPFWSTDSQAVFVHAFLDERQPVLRIAVPGGELRTVADLGAFADRATSSYFFGGLTPDNLPIVQAHVGAGDLYTLDLRRH